MNLFKKNGIYFRRIDIKKEGFLYQKNGKLKKHKPGILAVINYGNRFVYEVYYFTNNIETNELLINSYIQKSEDIDVLIKSSINNKFSSQIKYENIDIDRGKIDLRKNLSIYVYDNSLNIRGIDGVGDTLDLSYRFMPH
jgi:hypothetical protein